MPTTNTTSGPLIGPAHPLGHQAEVERRIRASAEAPKPPPENLRGDQGEQRLTLSPTQC